MLGLRTLGIQLGLLRPRGELVFPRVIRHPQVPARPRSVLFHFPDPARMHLGDHLFWEPAIRHLRGLGVDLAVSPIPALRGYFEALGHPLASKDDLGRFEVIATRYEFLFDPLLRQRPVLFFKQKQAPPGYPYCQRLTEQLCRILGLDPPGQVPPPAPWPGLPPFPGLAPEGRYLLFNNAVDSGRFRLFTVDRRRLLAACGELARRENLTVLHVGSAADAEGDRTDYHFPRIDLRGLTSVAELCALAADPRVEQTLSFDTFPAHLAMLLGKPATILQRRSWPRSEFLSVRTCFLPPFPPVQGFPPVRFLD